MENSIAYANDRMWADLATGAAGAIQGAAVSAISGSGPLAVLSGLSSFGLGAAGSMIERDISERQARDEQSLSERRVQGQAGTAYSSAYGVIYCLMNLRHPALIEVDMRGIDGIHRWSVYIGPWLPGRGSQVRIAQGGILSGSYLRGRYHPHGSMVR